MRSYPANSPQAAARSVALTVPREAVRSVGRCWQPKYSVPNAGMVEAVQMAARAEGQLLDPVYAGKVMAGLIGLARAGELRPGERVLFLHTGGLPSLHVYERVVLGETPVTGHS
jgi:D-cysteine desulfhydrase